MSRIKPITSYASPQMDSVKRSLGDSRRAEQVLFEAQRYYDNMDMFRKERERNKKYYFGDQWSDQIRDEKGYLISEEKYILNQGNVPLKNNLIHRLGRNVVGVYINQDKEPTCVARDRDEQRLGETMSTVLQYNRQLNRMKQLNPRSVEELLISSTVIHKTWYGWRSERNKEDCWTDMINPNNFFCDNNMRDPRGWDVSCIGEIHDVPFNQMCSMFARTQDDYSFLREEYHEASSRNNIADNCQRFGMNTIRNLDFFFPQNPTLCRFIEVWRKENKPRYLCHDYLTGDIFKIEIDDKKEFVDEENAKRLQQAKENGIDEAHAKLITSEWFIDNYWYFYYLTPFGHILDEGETPYAHGGHPYTFIMYPFIDGEIHSFVSDVIDQQRYVNRLITLHDWIMRASAKGALLWPEGSLPDGYSIEDIADEWSRYNGVIVYKPRADRQVPQQISSNSTNIGINELLSLQLKLFEDISGVNGALQGKPGYNSTSGVLYQQQAANATTSLLDILETYSAFTIEESYKQVQVMQQFYDTPRYINIAGKNSTAIYDPKKIKNVEFDLSIGESQTSQSYREISNNFLMQIWETGQISLQQLLQVGNFPFGDELLQSIQSQQQQLKEGQVPSDLSPNLRQQLQQQQQQTDMGAVNKLHTAMVE